MTDHRERAEQWLASAAEDLSGEHTTADATTGTLHALLAIHDLLAERLPESQPRNSTPEGAVWRPEGLTVAEAGRAAQEAAEAVRGVHSGDSDDQCPPPDEYVTILRADYDRLLDRQPAEDEVVVRWGDLRMAVNEWNDLSTRAHIWPAYHRLRDALAGEER